MKKTAFTLLCLFLSITFIKAQDLSLFSISDSNEKTFFVSLSDIYPNSEQPELKVIPDDKLNLEHYVLDAKFRKQFLTQAKIAENDSVFLYDYATNKLSQFAVKSLKIVANLSPYEIGGETPHSHYDYMIGFEIDKKQLKGFGDFFNTVFIYVGKQNPFSLKKLTPMTWKKVSTKEFPVKKINDEFGIFQEKYETGNTYRFEYENLQYLIQEYSREKMLFARRLFVIDSKTKASLYEQTFSEGESESLAPLNFIDKEIEPNQWIGKLFKNKETVHFGFTYHSFGCPYITVLGKKPSQVDIYCDNRH